MDPVSGAAVLVRHGVPLTDALRLVDEAKTGVIPTPALRAWPSAAGPQLPVRASSPITCTFVDTRWGQRLTTDCQPPLAAVASWLRAEGAASTVDHLLTLLRSPDGAHVIGFGPHQARTHQLLVWAARGRLLDGEPPRIMTTTANDMRTGRAVVLALSNMKHGDIERHLGALKEAATLEAQIDLIRREPGGSLVGIDTSADAGGIGFRVEIRRHAEP